MSFVCIKGPNVQIIDPLGKHNGTVQGRVYFRCPPGHGVFVKPSRLTRGPPSMDTETQTLIRQDPKTEQLSEERQGPEGGGPQIQCLWVTTQVSELMYSVKHI